ncbi:MAG: YaaR family protein [Treponema sp.]|nr:YaaR family protein [Treponema sp.]
MDKIDPTAASILKSAFSSPDKSSLKKTTSKDEVKSKSKFSEILETFAPSLGALPDIAPSEETLTALMDAVHSCGSDLVDRPFHDEILKYKKAVRNFVHYVVENSYEVYKDQGIKKKVIIRGEAKWKDVVYHQVRVIDQKLEELAAAILSGQADRLQRVSKTDEITGLLVDLTISGVIKERDG